MSASSAIPNQPVSPIPAFARGVVAILELWPALRLAVTEEWGGPDSASKRTWMASELVDFVESCMPAADPKSSPVSVAQGSSTMDVVEDSDLDNVADEDDLAEMLHNMMSDEFDTDLDDFSPEQVSKSLVKLWKEVVRSDTTMLVQLEEMVRSRAGQPVQAHRHGAGEELEVDEDGNPVAHDDDEEGDSEDEDEDEDMDAVDRVRAPKLVPAEPVVDDDGFTLVQGKGKKGR